jgi:hypothetical protein
MSEVEPRIQPPEPPAPTPQPAPPARRRWRAALIAGTVAWAVLLTAGGIYAARRGTPTVREHTTIVEALPVLDRVVTQVATAATGTGAAAIVSGYEQVGGSCRVAPGRTGVRYERTAFLYVTPGRESPLLDAVAAAAPKEWGLVVRKGRALQRITGDAGFYVRVEGGVTAPGRMRVTALTGCRERGGTVPGSGEPHPGFRMLTEGLLTGLKATGAQWRGFRADCGGGRTMLTVEATATRATEAALTAELRWMGDTQLSLPDVYAWHEGRVSQVVRTSGTQVVVQTTVDCQ